MNAKSLIGLAVIVMLVAECDVIDTSEPDHVTSISITPRSSTVLTNGSIQFGATANHASGKTIPITPEWDVISGGGSISTAGYYRAPSSPGSSTVRAKHEGMQATASVSVIASSRLPGPTPPPDTACFLFCGGSCPTVYSWDGFRWRIDSGTFGGAIAKGLMRTDIDNLEHARAVRDVVTLQVRNELDETDHIDAISLLVIDHKPGVTVAPASDGRIFGLSRLIKPIRAVDKQGNDILGQVARADGLTWESPLEIRDVLNPSSLTDPIEISFPRPRHMEFAQLLVEGQNTEWANHMLLTFLNAHGNGLNAWYARLNRDPAFARASRAALARTGFLHVSVWTRSGWQEQGLVWEVGPEVLKKQVVPLDLRKTASGDVRIRLEAPPSFWRIDHVALATGDGGALSLTRIPAQMPVLAKIDDAMKTVTTGHGFQLAFKVPPQPRGTQRTYMLSSTGWYQFNTSMTGTPNLDFLNSIAAGPRAMQRVSVELRNQLITRALQGS